MDVLRAQADNVTIVPAETVEIVGDDTVSGDDVSTIPGDTTDTFVIVADRGIMRYSMQYLYPFTYTRMTQVPDISGLENISYMYSGCEKLQNTIAMDTHAIKDLCGLFKGCKSLPATLPWIIDMYSLPHVSNRYYGSMVKDSSITQITITGIDQRNVADVTADLGITVNYVAPETPRKWDRRFKPNIVCTMNGLFPQILEYEIKKKIIDPLTGAITEVAEIAQVPKYQMMTDIEEEFTWNIEEVESMEDMFAYCYALEVIPDINGSATDKLWNMTHAFKDCEMLTTLPDIDIHDVTRMVETFAGCSSLKVLPDWAWTHTKIKNLQGCFDGCASLLYPPELNTEACVNFKYMYRGCRSLSDQYPYVINLRAVIEDLSSPGIENALRGMFEDSNVYSVTFDGVSDKYKSRINSDLLKGDDTLSVKWL